VRILMVSPYPPIRDGIASYAVQEVAALLDEGHDVEVLSPWPSAGHHHLALRGPRGPLALAKRVDGYDRVIVQFHPDVFYPLPLDDRQRLLVTAGLLAAFGRSRNVEVRLHEMNFEWGRESGLFGRLWRALWRLPVAITVHTERERELVAASVDLPTDRIQVRDHGRNFVRRAAIDRSEARARLGVDDTSFMFLALGFIQPHKGFDRAVTAFDGLADHGCRLDIVGSVRVDEPEFTDYANALRRRVEATRGAHMHEGYVSDETFDVWLVAADVLLLPYRHIWSSGVLQRAALYGTRVIATRVGALDEQGHEDVVLVESDLELAIEMRTAAGVAFQRTVSESWPVDATVSADRHAVQAAVRERAALMTEADFDAQWSASPDGVVPLDRVPLLDVPRPVSNNPIAFLAKRVVRKLTAWQIDPIVHRMNVLHRAAVEERAAPRQERNGAGPRRTPS